MGRAIASTRFFKPHSQNYFILGVLVGRSPTKTLLNIYFEWGNIAMMRWPWVNGKVAWLRLCCLEKDNTTSTL
jgi:hypothetical protein